eukprot:s576_g23.t1
MSLKRPEQGLLITTREQTAAKQQVLCPGERLTAGQRRRQGLGMIDDDEAAVEVLGRFQVIQKLGEGTYGKVYKAACHQTQQVRALKRIPIVMDEDGVPATAIREVSLLKECDHPNVIRLYDVFSLDRALYLVFEYVDMDLRIFLKRNGAFRNPHALKNAAFQCISKDWISQ